MEKTLVERFMRLFKGYSLKHGEYKILGNTSAGKYSGEARTVNRPASFDDFKRHLKGEEPGIGIVPLSEDDDNSMMYFGAVDVDSYVGIQEKLGEKISSLPLIQTRSKSDGSHLWLFKPSGIKAVDGIKVLKHWAAQLGYGGSEIFPKQSKRVDQNDIGNWINLPYFGDTRKAAVWDPKQKKTVQLSLEQFLDMAEKIDPDLDYLTKGALHVVAKSPNSSKHDFDDGPPCLQSLLRQASVEGLTGGYRNTLMFNIVTYLNRRYDGVQVRRIVEDLNRGVYTMKIPMKGGEVEDFPVPAFALPDKEIEQLLKSATQKTYSYQCKEPTLAARCMKPQCLGKKFGIGSSDTDLVESVDELTQVRSDTPYYIVSIGDNRFVIKDSDMLTNQKRYRNRVFDATGVFPPLLTVAQWEKFLSRITSTVTIVEALPESEKSHRVIVELENFLKVAKTDRADMILNGRCLWDEESRFFVFQGQSFMDWLNQKKVEYDPRLLDKQLKEAVKLTLGSGAKKRIGNVSVNTWKIPFDEVPGVFTNTEIAAPKSEDPPF